MLFNSLVICSFCLLFSNCHAQTKTDNNSDPIIRYTKSTINEVISQTKIQYLISKDDGYIENVLAYRVGTFSIEPISIEMFNKINKDMSLGEILFFLGPGFQYPHEGVGCIYWECEDDRILTVQPEIFLLNDKVKISINYTFYNLK